MNTQKTFSLLNAEEAVKYTIDKVFEDIFNAGVRYGETHSDEATPFERIVAANYDLNLVELSNEDLVSLKKMCQNEINDIDDELQTRNEDLIKNLRKTRSELTL